MYNDFEGPVLRGTQRGNLLGAFLDVSTVCTGPKWPNLDYS